MELRNKLHDILNTAIEDENITPTEEMKQVLFPYVKFEEDDEVSRESDFIENDRKNHSGESTQVTLEEEHSLLSELVLSQYNTEHARDIKDLPVYSSD